MNPETIKIRFRGKQAGGQWFYKTPRIVELPVPYLSKAEKIGEVLCDPVGEFPYEQGMKLLEICGENGPFELAEPLPKAEAIAVAIPVLDIKQRVFFLSGSGQSPNCFVTIIAFRDPGTQEYRLEDHISFGVQRVQRRHARGQQYSNQ